jgi:hypothetical protein
VRAVLEETLALPSAAAVSCLADGDGTEDSEERGDELHFDGGLSGWWMGVEMLEACGLIMVSPNARNGDIMVAPKMRCKESVTNTGSKCCSLLRLRLYCGISVGPSSGSLSARVIGSRTEATRFVSDCVR